jgi:hypothetical protein
MSDYQRDPQPRLSWWLTIGVNWIVRHVSWLMVCKCGAWRRWSMARRRSSRDCRADRPGAVKGGREACTEGLEGWVTSRGRWYPDIDERKCTWEWPCWPSQDDRCVSQARLRNTWRASRSRTAVTRVEWQGKHMEYTTRSRFRGFRPQNSGGGSKEERMTRGGIEEVV